MTQLARDAQVQGMTLAAHLRELRSRLVKSALAVLLATVSVWNQFPLFFDLIRKPFEQVTETFPNAILALTGVTSGFSLQLRVSLAVAIIVSSPVWLYQLWRFISPGLHRNERKWAYAFTLVAVPLFVSGIALAYAVMPKMLEVLFTFTPNDVSNVTSVDSYLSFFFHLTLFFGIGFLLPLVLVMLNVVGILSSRTLLSSWRWIILGSFIFGAVATPSGDPLGMTFVAIPMMILSLIAIGITQMIDRSKARKSQRAGTDQWDDNEQSPVT